jgi:hypothetical protein
MMVCSLYIFQIDKNLLYYYFRRQIMVSPKFQTRTKWMRK